MEWCIIQQVLHNSTRWHGMASLDSSWIQRCCRCCHESNYPAVRTTIILPQLLYSSHHIRRQVLYQVTWFPAWPPGTYYVKYHLLYAGILTWSQDHADRLRSTQQKYQHRLHTGGIQGLLFCIRSGRNIQENCTLFYKFNHLLGNVFDDAGTLIIIWRAYPGKTPRSLRSVRTSEWWVSRVLFNVSDPCSNVDLETPTCSVRPTLIMILCLVAPP